MRGFLVFAVDGSKIELPETKKKAFFLVLYLQRNENILKEYNNVSVCLLGMETEEKEIIYRIFLENLFFEETAIGLFHRKEGIGTLEACGKTGLSIDLSKEEEYFSGKNLQYLEILDTPMEPLNQ